MGQEQASAWSVNIADIGTLTGVVLLMLHLLQTIHRIASHPGQAADHRHGAESKKLESRPRARPALVPGTGQTHLVRSATSFDEFVQKQEQNEEKNEQKPTFRN